VASPFAVHLVSDESVARESIDSLFTAACLVSLGRASVNKFVDILKGSSGGFVVINVHMPGIDASDLRSTTLGTQNLPVVIIASAGGGPSDERTKTCMDATSVENPVSEEAFVDGVRSAVEDVSLAKKFGSMSGQNSLPVERLTPRERDVFDLLILGQANKEIARRLDISPRTVEIHRANMLGKMGVTNASELIRLAALAGMN
jgi:two-component system response regulator FixJ